jgi:signal peptidase I
MLFRRLPQPWRTIADWALTIGLAIGFVLAFEAEIAKPYRIPSSSMEPTLHCARPELGCRARFSDRIIAAKIIYRFRAPERGDIVVFKTPAATSRACRTEKSATFVKRIVGMPGDTITEQHGFVSVNGRPLSEPYVLPSLRDNRDGTWTVPERSYFMMGDDRRYSCDSRDWGSVPRKDLIGPVVATYWPPTRLGVH